jgi:phosphotransferase system enzyme I (PtsP)
MGIDSLSMSAASLLRVKWVVRSFSQGQARALLGEALQLEDGKAVQDLVHRSLEQTGLGGLIRAGR